MPPFLSRTIAFPWIPSSGVSAALKAVVMISKSPSPTLSALDGGGVLPFAHFGASRPALKDSLLQSRLIAGVEAVTPPRLEAGPKPVSPWPQSPTSHTGSSALMVPASRQMAWLPSFLVWAAPSRPLSTQSLARRGDLTTCSRPQRGRTGPPPTPGTLHQRWFQQNREPCDQNRMVQKTHLCGC